MTEQTMEEYMTETREDYGSGVARPKFNKDAKFDLKDVTQDQLMLRVFPISLTGAASRWLRNQLAGLDVPTRQILDFKGGVPKMKADDATNAIQEMADYSQKWHDGTSSRNKNSNTSNGLVAIQAQLNNLGREIKKVDERVYATQVGCELCNRPHYTKDCDRTCTHDRSWIVYSSDCLDLI
nr:hypothetical protein [Tanacetum cinerariifolium]